ncbi:MAG: HDOD domain-containing protein [Spirochaetes bacterium]|nr:MAG: HDOD domain-containing protein [Spirochaetota bacterium]
MAADNGVPRQRTSDITSKIFNGEPYALTFPYFSEDVSRFINALFAKLLSRADRIFLLDMIITITREIFVNAVKANAKRVFFLRNNIDINDPDEYSRGVAQFKKAVVGQFESIAADLEKSDYRVTLEIEKRDGVLAMKVINNAPIHPVELSRIQMRQDKAKEFEDFTDAFDEIYDDTEGAGLGIVLVVLLLRNSGVGTDNYAITTDGKTTTTVLNIPSTLRPEEVTSDIKKRLLAQVQGIPTFPEHIFQLQQLCADPESTIQVISDKIMGDPALATDVLKLSNSAGFVPAKRIETISEAVMTIGLKNLNAVLVATGARRIMDKRFQKFEQIWNHCNLVAFYARRIAMKFKLSKVVENAYLAGLLHDLGKIVMLSTDLNLTNSIADIVQNRKIRTSTVIEEISVGISHAQIGALIAEKWGFPAYLIEAIRHHHTPLAASQPHAELVGVVYLANLIAGIESRKYQFSYVDEEILERYNLIDSADFTALHEELKALLKQQSL